MRPSAFQRTSVRVEHRPKKRMGETDALALEDDHPRLGRPPQALLRLESVGEGLVEDGPAWTGHGRDVEEDLPDAWREAGQAAADEHAQVLGYGEVPAALADGPGLRESPGHLDREEWIPAGSLVDLEQYGPGHRHTEFGHQDMVEGADTERTHV